ncbi:SDR family NAD(P)-dependent oxidoreductase [Legionella spiritensis]|uniref:SDR family NAD(P)-dependent oxidoreductase n=1 Tax=Legionella spiritensis TaxID=452 RepID=UPI000F718711|nr:SDR family oxidoreductase [Legionella spiritensis]VEG90959.1 short-chain dehydrogenases/reductases family protein [Legionella spiritensis]
MFEKNLLSEKRVIVTGGSSGIGAEIAKVFAEYGASLWIAGGRDKLGLTNTLEVCSNYGARVDGNLYDLSNSKNAEDIIQNGVDYLGGIDILVNGAGTRDLNSFTNIDNQAIDLLFEVNAKAPFIAAREAAKHMKKQGSGHILMIGSEAAEHGTPNFSLYSVTKATMHALTKNLAIELGPHGLQVNCLAMGPIKSGRVKELLENDPEFYKSRINKVPIREFGDPHNIAKTALFMVSPVNHYMNGSIILVDGGITSL